MRHAIAVAVLGKISPRVAHRIPRGIIRSGIKYRRNLNKFKRCNRVIGELAGLEIAKASRRRNDAKIRKCMRLRHQEF